MTIADDLTRIAFQEQTLILPHLDPETAWRLGTRLREMALARHAPLAIDIRRFDQSLFFCALPGVTPNNLDWVRRKSRVVAHFHRSSYAIGLELEQKKLSMEERYGLPFREYAAHGGGFPLHVQGAGVIGSVTVSGLPQRDDHELVVEALALETGRDYASLKLSDEG